MTDVTYMRGMKVLGDENESITRRIDNAIGEWGHMAAFPVEMRQRAALVLGLTPLFCEYVRAWKICGRSVAELATLGLVYDPRYRAICITTSGIRGQFLARTISESDAPGDCMVKGDSTMFGHVYPHECVKIHKGLSFEVLNDSPNDGIEYEVVEIETDYAVDRVVQRREPVSVASVDGNVALDLDECADGGGAQLVMGGDCHKLMTVMQLSDKPVSWHKLLSSGMLKSDVELRDLRVTKVGDESWHVASTGSGFSALSVVEAFRKMTGTIATVVHVGANRVGLFEVVGAGTDAAAVLKAELNALRRVSVGGLDAVGVALAVKPIPTMTKEERFEAVRLNYVGQSALEMAVAVKSAEIGYDPKVYEVVRDVKLSDHGLAGALQRSSLRRALVLHGKEPIGTTAGSAVVKLVAAALYEAAGVVAVVELVCRWGLHLAPNDVDYVTRKPGGALEFRGNCHKVLTSEVLSQGPVSWLDLVRSGKLLGKEHLVSYYATPVSHRLWHVARDLPGVSVLKIVEAAAACVQRGKFEVMVSGVLVDLRDEVGAVSAMTALLCETLDTLGVGKVEELELKGGKLAGNAIGLLSSGDKDRCRVLQAVGDAALTLVLTLKVQGRGDNVQVYQELRSRVTSNAYLAEKFVQSVYFNAFRNVGPDLSAKTGGNAVEAMAGAVFNAGGLASVMELVQKLALFV